VSNPIFSRRAALLIWLGGGASLLTFMLYIVFGSGVSEPESAGNDSYSRSAVGHHVLAELLAELDVSVTVSRHASGHRAGETAILVLAEPNPDTFLGPLGSEVPLMLDSAAVVLLVLPKWDYQEDDDRDSWIRANRPLPAESVARVLQAADDGGSIVRLTGEPGEPTTNALGIDPELDAPQLVSPGNLVPLVAYEGGLLLGEVPRDEGILYVLSDPDILANHGIGRGRNAEFIVRTLMDLGAGERPVVIDETTHGHAARPSVWRHLFGFPLLITTLHALLTLGILFWAATGRFGAPESPRVGLMAGKGILIDNTAELLQFTGHATNSLRRYLEQTVHHAAARLHAPPSRPEALLPWLATIARRRGVTEDLEALDQQIRRLRATRSIGDSTALALARRVHAFKEELLHGS